MSYPNSKRFYPDEIIFIRKNINTLNNNQLLEYINDNRPDSKKMKRSCFISYMARFKLQRYKQCRRWTQQEVKILKSSYRTKGNKEILSLLNANIKRYRKFSLKSVMKKMNLLGLKRTEQELNFIRADHKSRGAFSGLNLGRLHRKVEVGNEVIRTYSWGRLPFVKVGDNKFISSARAAWIKHNGSIPEKNVIYHIDKNPFNNQIENLECISFAELQKRNRSKYLNDDAYRLEITLLHAKKKCSAAQKVNDTETVLRKEKLIKKLTIKLEKYYESQQNNNGQSTD